jgi:hypothetical protein
MHENSQERFLVRSHDVMEFPWEREDEVKVGCREEFFTPGLQPSVRIRSMTLRATAIAAGVVGVMEGSALIALEDMSSERPGAAAGDIHKGSAVGRQHAITEALQIRRPVLSKDLCELRHGRMF